MLESIGTLSSGHPIGAGVSHPVAGRRPGLVDRSHRTPASSDLELLAAVAEATRALHGHSVEDTARIIVELAKDLVPGTTWATVVNGRRKQSSVRTLGSTAGTPDTLARSQHRAKCGPSLDAMWSEDAAVFADDLRRDDRWADFRRAALASGVRSLISVRLSVSSSGHCLGALNLFSDRSATGDLTSLIIAHAFAAHASIALDKATFQRALHNRELIGQAKGILMERHRVDPQAAFDMLVTSSQHANRSLDDVAQRLVLTGELPT